MFDTDRTTGTPAEYIARRAKTVGDMFLKRVERDGDKPAFYFKEDGEWQPVSWNAFAEQARKSKTNSHSPPKTLTLAFVF